jgi:hypothetical protein
MSKELDDVLKMHSDVLKIHSDVLGSVRCSMVAMMIAALDRDAVNRKTFDELCDRYTTLACSLLGSVLDEDRHAATIWAGRSIAKRVRSNTSNTLIGVYHRMAQALHYIASNHDNLDIPLDVILRVPEAVEQTLQWFGLEWSNDASFTLRPLATTVALPVLKAAIFYAAADDDGEDP